MEAKRSSYAIWAGVLLPGLGHLYARRMTTALVAFASVTALFLIGHALAEYRIYAFTGPLGSTESLLGALIHKLPIHLIPECGNFAEATIAWLMQPEYTLDHSRALRLPIATEHVGLAMTAAAGVLNCFFAADAGWLVASDQYFEDHSAQRGHAAGWLGRPAFIAFLAWLVPGLGHALVGRKKLAWVVGLSLSVLFVLGLFFSGFCGVDRSQLYWWWAAEFGMGGPVFLGNIILGPLQITQDIPTIDLGITLLSIAGLMNLVVVTDVYTVAERRALGLPEDTSTQASKTDGVTP